MAPEHAVISHFPRLRARILVLEHQAEQLERQLAVFAIDESTQAEANRAAIMLQNTTNELTEIRELLAMWEHEKTGDGRITIQRNTTVIALMLFVMVLTIVVAYSLSMR